MKTYIAPTTRTLYIIRTSPLTASDDGTGVNTDDILGNQYNSQDVTYSKTFKNAFFLDTEEEDE